MTPFALRYVQKGFVPVKLAASRLLLVVHSESLLESIDR